MARKNQSRGRGTFPWEYDAQLDLERASGRLRGRRRKKALSKLEKQRERARRIKTDRNRPLDIGVPKMIRPWPQGWRLPTPSQPMTAKEYARYLQTPHWQAFRERYRVSDLPQVCFVCGAQPYELHHHTYARLGAEGLEDVVPLCEGHHRAVHKAVKAGVRLSGAHTYVKMRFQRGELGLRCSQT